MTEITREEIERAIHEIEHNVDCDNRELYLTLLRAELTRQENAPLTCDGCNNLRTKYDGNRACEVCSRGTFLLDRYEPKGESK